MEPGDDGPDSAFCLQQAAALSKKRCRSYDFQCS